MELPHLVEYLEALVKGLRAGKVVVEKGSKKAKFSLELSWKSGAIQSVDDAIRISSDEPAAANEESSENLPG